ncbi:hypothetical protein SEA_CAMBIARE_35 [Mycobacterium phage Cambiare]|uniref:Uncharacterized protein n=1 Tax=Mycobacterium phage Cambiare TaxID=1647305 RepID=A0A0F6SJN7_9CAUD|nr:hypothetical protein AVT48_gp35 [Mycobacterium phage Cambiare]AKF14537.1 hypothetical protein SEA_CAMBIARE_35 [Mycobacterium phage Cambiare]
MSGSMDDQQVRLVNVDDECVFAVIAFPNGTVDLKSRLTPAELADALRSLADAIDRKASTN